MPYATGGCSGCKRSSFQAPKNLFEFVFALSRLIATGQSTSQESVHHKFHLKIEKFETEGGGERRRGKKRTAALRLGSSLPGRRRLHVRRLYDTQYRKT
jgi:hypothetical protein